VPAFPWPDKYMDVKQNTLFLTTPGLYVSRENLTLRIEQDREIKLIIPIHHLESVCIFGPMIITPEALRLCFEHGVGVNHFSETGYFIGRWEGVPNTSVTLRRSQYRAADDLAKSAVIAKHCIAGKIQNARQSLLRSARENSDESESGRLQRCAEELSGVLRRLQVTQDIDQIRGHEGQAARIYFGIFDLHLKQQRDDFHFKERSRRPPRDEVNCLLSFIYALLLHDCIAALTATGLDPYVGYLHEDRSNRPGLALDLMEEFRPALADRLAMTMINRKQIGKSDFLRREGGAVEFTDNGRKSVLTAWQTRKQDLLTHPVLEQECRLGQVFLIQARILARHLRGDIPEYLSCVFK